MFDKSSTSGCFLAFAYLLVLLGKIVHHMDTLCKKTKRRERVVIPQIRLSVVFTMLELLGCI